MPPARRLLKKDVNDKDLTFVNKFKSAFMPVEHQAEYLDEAARLNREKAEREARELAARKKRRESEE